MTDRSQVDDEDDRQLQQQRIWPRTPFPINRDINERVLLYDGDLKLLTADAVVNPTSENMSQLGFIEKFTAIQELEVYLKKKHRPCSTGDVRLSPGFSQNFKYIIHAVPPKYQPKYKTAAETALFYSYFRIMNKMVDEGIRTCVMPILATPKCNLPEQENFVMQLRVIRRFLERKWTEIDKIVLYVSQCNQFQSLFYCYFPRTKYDEEFACYNLDSSVGGANGEPVIPEREIRVKWPLPCFE